jgi:hypothetical protein
LKDAPSGSDLELGHIQLQQFRLGHIHGNQLFGEIDRRKKKSQRCAPLK